MKIKSHIGLIIVLCIIVILVAVPVSLFVYLRCSDFEEELSQPHPDAISHSVQFNLDKTANLLLPESSLQEAYDIFFAPAVEEQLSVLPFVSLQKIDFRLIDRGLMVYADATVFGFLQFHLKMPVSMSIQNNLLFAEVGDIQLGRKMTVSSQLLQRVGMPDTLEMDLTDCIGMMIGEMTFHADYGEASVSSFKYEEVALKATVEAYHTATAFWVLYPDSTCASEIRRMIHPESVFSAISSSDLCQLMLSAEDPALMMKQLLALDGEETSKALVGELPDFALRFVYCFSEQDVENLRTIIYSELEAVVEPYDKAMTAVEEDWCGLDWEVRPKGIFRKSTGKRFSIAEFDESLVVNGDNGELLMLNSTGSVRPVKSRGLPYLADISFSKANMKKGMPMYALGIGIHLTLPCGEKAMIAHLEAGGIQMSLFSDAALEAARKEMPEMNVPNNPYFLYETKIKKSVVLNKAIQLPNLDTILIVMVPAN